MTDETTAALEPCPFCGGGNLKVERHEIEDNDRAPRPHYVYRIECCATMDSWSARWSSGNLGLENDQDLSAKAEVIEMWNKRTLATSDKRADAFAYAVWMVGNMDTTHDKAAWWSDFQQVWDMAAERVQAMSDRCVKIGQGFAATGLMGAELDAAPAPTVGGSK